jgi:hypothetical protein
MWSLGGQLFLVAWVQGVVLLQYLGGILGLLLGEQVGFIMQVRLFFFFLFVVYLGWSL